MKIYREEDKQDKGEVSFEQKKEVIKKTEREEHKVSRRRLRK